MHISLKAEHIFTLGNFLVSNTLILSFFIFLLFVFTAWFLKQRLALVPQGFQNAVEFIIEKALGLMEPVLGSRRLAEKYLPLVATIFFLVLFSNWFEIIPGVGSILIETKEGAVPLLRSPSTDLNFTLALALTTVIVINAIAIITLGIRKHIGKFLNFKSPTAFFVGILETIAETAKVISFSFRLFGNIFAGEVLLVVIAVLVPYIVPVPFFALEVFVGFIQALVFAMLALVFLAVATAEHH